MAQRFKIGRRATRVIKKDLEGMTTVVYHSTPIVRFNDHKIILDTGGWWSLTTRTRMCQASHQFNLGYMIYQKQYKWYISFGLLKDMLWTKNRLILDRKVGIMYDTL